MKYVAIGFVLVFAPGVLVALVWGFAQGVRSPDKSRGRKNFLSALTSQQRR